MDYLSCWQSKEHAGLFDYRVYFPSFRLKKIYNFNELRLLDKLVYKNEKISLLDVGCATGELYRYFKSNYPNIDYVGCDISEVAIRRAKTKYPRGKFILTDSNLAQVKDTSLDYLFSRDVVVHQVDPFYFIELLLSIPKKGVILRLRTRDVGKTVLDIDKSCQLNYGKWAPYIIINCEELISFLKSFKKCSKIILFKNYMPLGGLNYRYLPKDCYLESAGTSETAVYIELAEIPQHTEVIIKSKKDNYPPAILDRVLYKIIKTIVGLRYNGAVWW